MRCGCGFCDALLDRVQRFGSLRLNGRRIRQGRPEKSYLVWAQYPKMCSLNLYPTFFLNDSTFLNFCGRHGAPFFLLCRRNPVFIERHGHTAMQYSPLATIFVGPGFSSLPSTHDVTHVQNCIKLPEMEFVNTYTNCHCSQPHWHLRLLFLLVILSVVTLIRIKYKG